ncbi:MAG: HGxxPAAW family protein [Nostocoides sp.]
MAEQDPLDSHGKSVAAWTCVGILLVAATVMSAAVLWPNVAVFIVGAVIAVIGVVVGKWLSMAGYGAKPPTPREPVELH